MKRKSLSMFIKKIFVSMFFTENERFIVWCALSEGYEELKLKCSLKSKLCKDLTDVFTHEDFVVIKKE